MVINIHGGLFIADKDDMEYVNKDIYGNFSLSGAIFLTKKTEDDMAHFISYVEKNATNIRDDLNIQPADKLIALSTCVDAATNGRALVIGRLTK